MTRQLSIRRARATLAVLILVALVAGWYAVKALPSAAAVRAWAEGIKTWLDANSGWLGVVLAALGFTLLGILAWIWSRVVLPFLRRIKDEILQVARAAAGRQSIPARRPLEDENGETIFTDETGARLTAVALDPSESRLACGGFSGTARILTVTTGEAVATAAYPGIIRAIRFHPNGTALAIAGDDGQVLLFDLQSRKRSYLGRHQGPVYGLAFEKDGSRLYSAGRDGAIKVWDTAKSTVFLGATTPTRLPESEPIAILRHTEGSVFSLSIRSEERLLVSAGVGGVLYVWSLDSLSGTRLRTGSSTVFCVSLAPHGPGAAIGCADGAVELWDLDRKEFRNLPGNADAARWVSFDSTGLLLASAGKDRTVRVWRCDTLQCWILTGHSDYVYAAEFGRDRSLYSVGGDGTLKKWALPDDAVGGVPEGPNAT